MPEEYVYKIVVDDAEIQRTLDRVDQRIKTLATRADQSFAKIGSSMASGLSQTVQQAQQASQEIAQTEQRTGQQLQRTYGQVGQAATQAYSQRRQEAVRTAQEEIRSAQQVVAEAKKVNQARQDELQGAKRAAVVIKACAKEKAAAAKVATRAVTDQAKVERAARAEINIANKTGNEVAIQMAQDKHKLTAQTLEDLSAEKSAAVESANAETAKIAKYETSQASRQTAATATAQAVTNATNQEKTAIRSLKTETRAAAREQRQLATRQKQGQRAFIRTTKTYNQQRTALHNLAKRYGSFNVPLGKTSGTLNKQEKEVMDIIKSDKQLEAEIEKLIAKYGELDVAIERSTFRGGRPGGIAGTNIQGQQFRQAGFAAQRFGIPGAAVLGEAAMVGGGAGIAVAGVLLSVKALTTAFLSMGKAAFNALSGITRSATEAAKELEIASAQFTAFFQGDTQASEAAMNRLLDLSKELGENVVGIGRAFLPEVESLDQLEEVVKLATALARFQPEQGMMGARIALQEALSGEFRSLQRRFEISPVAIDKIRQAYEASGISGFLEGLQTELSRTGRSVEDLSDTWGVAMGRVREMLRQIAAELGKPVVDEYKDQLNEINDELDRLEPDLMLIANAFGEVISKIVELVGTELQTFLESFDPQPVLELAESAFRVVSAIEAIISVAEPGAAASSSLGLAAEGLAGLMLSLEGWLLRVAKQMNSFRDEFRDTLMFMVNSARITGRIIAMSGGFIDPLTPIKGITGELTDQLDELYWSLEKMEDLEPFDWDKKMAEYEARVEAFNDGLDAFADKLAESGDEGEQAANDFALLSQSMDAARVAAEDFAAAQEKVNEVLEEFQIAADIKFEKILTNVARQSLDDEIAAQRKLVDIEIKNRQKLAGIGVKYDQSVIDAAQELGDREADIARKNGRALLDLELDLADKRIELEKDYQNDLERLRDKFNFDAFEAILANDAKRLRQIRRRQSFEETQAKKDRDKDRRELEDEGTDRQAELEKQLARELEDARIVNGRKIRDLQQSLQRQLNAQEEARRKDIASSEQSEERKRNDLERSLARQLDDYRAWWNERNRVTQEKVAEDKAMAEQMAQNWQEAVDKIRSIGVPELRPQIGPQPGPWASGYVFPQQPAGQAGNINQPLLTDVMQQIVDIQSAFSQQAGRPVDNAALEEAVAKMDVPALVQELTKLQDKLDVFTALEFNISTMSLDDLAERLLIPVSGAPPSIADTPEIEAIRDRIIELKQILREVQGIEPFPADVLQHIQAPVGDLSVIDLVAELERIQKDLKVFTFPMQPEEELLSTEGLAESLLKQQTATAGAGIGLDPVAIYKEVSEMTAEQIQEFLDDLLLQVKTAAPTGVGAAEEADEPAPITPEIISTTEQLAGMDRDEPTPVTVVDPSGQPVLPFSLAAPTSPEPEEEPAAPTIVPEIVSTTDLLAGMGRDEPVPVTMVTPAGQALAITPPKDVPELLNVPSVAGAFLQPTDPSQGYSSEGIMDAIQAEVEAVAAAELEKLGEIEDTVKHAELLAEAKLIAASSALDDEVGAYQIASDAEIAILESTLTKHRAALTAMSDDPALAADAAVLETSIGVLNDTLARLREESQQNTQAILDAEVSDVKSAEGDKANLIYETTALIGLAAQDREAAIKMGLLQEVADTDTAKKAETELLNAALASQGEATAIHREEELAAIEENEEEKADIFGGSNQAHLTDLHSFWIRWLAQNNTAMTADLTQMFQWLQERQRMFEQATATIPGGGLSPGGGTAPGGEEEEEAEPITSINQLRNLATNLATTLGILDDYASLIASLPYEDLASLVLNWQEQVAVGNYALGGGVSPSTGYAWVGEDGPELVRFNQAARIDPAHLFRNAPPAGIGGGITTIDQSMSNQFSFPDPRGIPPTYIATMENIAAKVIKKSYRGRYK